jgi:dihydroneopterin aldolase
LNEEEVLKWLIEQKNTATIEEVTDEILEHLIEEYEYVVVYFSKYNSLLNVMTLEY